MHLLLIISLTLSICVKFLHSQISTLQEATKLTRQNCYPSIHSVTCIDYLVAVRICTYSVAAGGDNETTERNM